MSIAIITYTDVQCCECGIPFGLPQDYVLRRKGDHGFWHCPNGHSQHWPQKSDADILRERLAEKERALTAAACREANERSARVAAEQKLKRTCKRVHAGVCPCCNRTFSQLAAHMKTKHPNYAPSK